MIQKELTNAIKTQICTNQELSWCSSTIKNITRYINHYCKVTSGSKQDDPINLAASCQRKLNASIASQFSLLFAFQYTSKSLSSPLSHGICQILSPQCSLTRVQKYTITRKSNRNLGKAKRACSSICHTRWSLLVDCR